MHSRIPVNAPIAAIDPIMDEITTKVARIVQSGWWINGVEVSSFEDGFAAYCDVPHCAGVGNGTDGLELALRSIGAEGAEVITVANAGGYTTAACRLVGARPVYIDVTSDRLVMDVEAVAAALTDDTRAVVATHLYGNTVDIGRLREELALAGHDDVMIIEDGSQAHGARLPDGRRVGSAGDISVFSFYPTKNLGALGDAGAVVTRHSWIHDRLVALKQYGWTARYESTVPKGRNSRMDEIQAGVLNVKLPHLDAWNEERRRIVRVYQAALPPHIQMVTDTNGAAHLAVVRHPHRKVLAAHLDHLGIGTGVHFPVLDPEQPSQVDLPSTRLDLPESELACVEILTIPAYPGMPSDSIERVAAGLASFSSDQEGTT